MNPFWLVIISLPNSRAKVYPSTKSIHSPKKPELYKIRKLQLMCEFRQKVAAYALISCNLWCL